ncbi:MAG TPA: hypothetical protein VHR47_01250 [Bacillota bacterium]|nr:hypothetical protein [Bacillota bacterium]
MQVREMVGAWLHRGANIGEGYFSLFVTNNPGQEGRAGSKRHGERRHCPYFQTHRLLVVSELLSVMKGTPETAGSGDFFGYFFRRGKK